MDALSLILTQGNIDIADPLWQVRLLAALRIGDVAQIQAFLNDIRTSRKSDTHGAALDDKPALILHFAIRGASCETLELVLANKYISPNLASPPDSGFTALHLASSLGRVEALKMLLDQDGADDTILDSRGQSPLDVAKDLRTAQVLQESQESFRRHFQTVLSRYIQSPNQSNPYGSTELLAILRSPRAKLLELSTLDTTSGTTLLHEAVRRRDQVLVEAAVLAGADVFVRDQRGRGLLDGDKDKGGERIRAFLRQYLNQDVTLIGSTSNDPPFYKGYLSKYANVAKGYNTRWFVLKDDMLSYYRSREDEGLAVRGAISVRTARLKTTPGDKLRFEIHTLAPSAQSSGNSTAVANQKWYMKANHPGEVARWVQMIGRSIEFYQQKDRSQAPLPNSDAESIQSAHGSTRRTKSLRSSVDMLRGWSGLSIHSNNRSRVSVNQPPPPVEPSISQTTREAAEMADNPEDDSRSQSSGDTSTSQIPHDEQFQLQCRSMQMEINLARQLLDQLSLPADSPTRFEEVKAALERSLLSVKDSIDQYVSMANDREAWYATRVEREADARRIWEENVVALANQSERIERELVRSVQINKGQRRFLKNLLGSGGSEDPATPRPTIDVVPPAEDSSPTAETQPPLEAPEVPAPIIIPEPTQAPARSPLATKFLASESEDLLGDDSDTDEFFDAIESGAISGVPSAIIPRPSAALPPSLDPILYQGYQNLRERLPISNDNRPPVSLWAVLKGSIGKDLTKISFPVYFNEPTSMLQRMAEDMEFSECLDAAANERDPHKRIAYVAAFAMSNYSSTIGRIAKPFNPMLGETFEYCRLDKQYRYLSEQVSHHPPMSASWAESPSWNFYGEVDAKNKFMGKSFEIRPTGIVHAELKLPAEWAPNYPPATGELEIGCNKVIEHYSWKKVITNVSGFIVGQPTLDHYGDMTIINHRTGDTCLLTFKPRGWRARDSFEIKGTIQDSSGRVTWELAGRWNSQLVARPAGTGAGDLLPDADSSQYLLLWKNSEKPAMPFNLTPFAITLNDCPPDTLAPYLPPTDCRVRPDQRAFESGRYERANELKALQEEFQRATRRKREIGEIPPHKPRWFKDTVDEDTGERMWQPHHQGDRLEYWAERERVFKQGGKGKAQWENSFNLPGEHVYVVGSSGHDVDFAEPGTSTRTPADKPVIGMKGSPSPCRPVVPSHFRAIMPSHRVLAPPHRSL
ncbi:SWH1-protein of an oxysterol-binding family protein [Ceratobasidium theobromae]|uniref:SWH1-protein of an oxysterol-binding family protein n=1 Tax=Ceratobasidium theobromae TaxID=1582974 RepID=A0A5N5Q9N7_9AGAM|nr:SWH1-protein of an oxysterol-binding family protein [Ceratobasidium theobromae]